jgi:hypothetical protein
MELFMYSVGVLEKQWSIEFVKIFLLVITCHYVFVNTSC